MRLPTPRGPLSRELCAVVAGENGRLPGLASYAHQVSEDPPADVLGHEDVQLSLLVLYELHYQGFDGVDPDLEWSPDLLSVRRVLERLMEGALRSQVRVPALPEATAPAVAGALATLTADDDEGPSLSEFLARRATAGQFREFLVHRSAYQLKEADPHTWALPRLTGRAKAALVEVQMDEYGGGRPERMHSVLFAGTMRALGLDDTYGAHVDQVPAVALATVNAMSLFGLQRRLRGAVAGHLAAYEMTSTLPNRRYGAGLRRLGFGPDATCFFDEHVEADAVHEQIAAHDLCGGLVEDQPELLPDVLLGAATAVELDRRFAEHVLAAWSAGTSSLRAAGVAARRVG